ncbi:MAG: hypothetical protein ACD_5C00006G0003 [uncultured bacterium]|nr:MAG: hypothetical protein ACD_5C00006G0003 [uncultured bacterium]
MPSDIVGNDKNYTDEDGYVMYYKKVSIAELNTSKMASVSIYKQVYDDPNNDWDNGFAGAFGGAWELYDDFVVEDGKVWIEYAYTDDATPAVTSYPVKNYKIVVKY